MSMLASPNSPLLTLQCSASAVPQASCFALGFLVFSGLYVRYTGFRAEKQHEEKAQVVNTCWFFSLQNIYSAHFHINTFQSVFSMLCVQ